MSDKFTRIRLPGQKDFTGLLEWDEVSVDAVISAARRYADALRKQAEAIEAATDAEFQIDIVRGNYVQHHIRELQKSSRSEKDRAA